MQMPEAATVSVLRKKVFFKVSQNSQETPVPDEISVNFEKFLRTPFSQNTFGRLLLLRFRTEEALIYRLNFAVIL